MINNVVAIIPARGGSKRIPRKNIKIFHGKPLITYSIETAIKSGIFDRVIVSTDDEEIAHVSKMLGAEVPFIRPKELSDDFTMPQKVIDHCLDYLDRHIFQYDFYCTIYPTAPFMKCHYLSKGCKELFKNLDLAHVFSATSMPYPIQRSFKVTKEGRCQMFWPENYDCRSQDLEQAYHDAGQFYFVNRLSRKKLKNKMVFSPASLPIILPRYLVQDLDTMEDWETAELMFETLSKKKLL